MAEQAYCSKTTTEFQCCCTSTDRDRVRTRSVSDGKPRTVTFLSHSSGVVRPLLLGYVIPATEQTTHTEAMTVLPQPLRVEGSQTLHRLLTVLV